METTIGDRVMKIETIAGITYSTPSATVLQQTPLLVAELAGRTAYDSFDKSEHDVIRNFTSDRVDELDANSSEILDSLAWVHHHHSVLEHLSLSYLVTGTSRGVLQEIVRHRIASYTVRSTRYTMQDILHAFNACSISPLGQAKYNFLQLIKPMNMFVPQGAAETLEINHLYDKLHYQLMIVSKDEFANLTMGKDARAVYESRTDYQEPLELFNKLSLCKAKRNVGDAFKWVVTDNWKVDMVVTFNLRSLKNYFQLRESGAAYFQIRWLAKAMQEATPSKYLDLIVKQNKTKDTE